MAEGPSNHADALTLISVVIPALNEEHFLPNLLASLFAQRGTRLEVIVVEGNSADATVAAGRRVGEQNKNPNISLQIHTVTVRNVSYQRNYGVARSTGEYLLFLDADVRLPDPDWAHRLLTAFRRRRLAIAGCRFRPIENHLLAHINYFGLYLFHCIMQYINPYATGAMLFTTRQAFDQVGGFDERLTLNEDANLVKRITAFGRFRVLPLVCETSARRFIRGGYLKTGVNYLRIFWNRTLHGENTSTLGYWDEPPHNKKT